MICEKCGSNNPKNSTVCTKCGAKMPETECCGGFADILSYDVSLNKTDISGEKTVQELEKKLNTAISAQKKLTLVSVISLVLCLVFLVLFIFSSCNIGGCNSANSGDTKVENTDKKDDKGTSEEDNFIKEGLPGFLYNNVIDNAKNIFK